MRISMLFVSVVPVLAVSPLHAELITFVFEGTVNETQDGLGALGGVVAPGAALKGGYTFDSETPNSAPPTDEGELGLYEHDQPPAGVTIGVGPFVFFSSRAAPEFDIYVADEFGFGGTDEYGFFSGVNDAVGLFPSAPIDLLDLSWLAVTFTENPIESAALPLVPPDLARLGGGELLIYGECLQCLGPFALFRITGELTSLELAPRAAVERGAVHWSGVPHGIGVDVVTGSLTTLRTTGGDFGVATDDCLIDGSMNSSIPLGDPLLLPGEGRWYLIRHETYDAPGIGQSADRDAAIAASGADC